MTDIVILMILIAAGFGLWIDERRERLKQQKLSQQNMQNCLLYQEYIDRTDQKDEVFAFMRNKGMRIEETDERPEDYQ